MSQSFTGLTIAVPESRQLSVLVDLFVNRGAEVVRCPLVAIHDNPDVETIEGWLQGFIADTPDYFIILTGEGIRRLTSFAQRAGLLEGWQSSLAITHKLARGPKPNRALRELDLQAEAMAVEPTTDGMILSLDAMNLANKRLSVQLYGQDPNQKLQNYLQSRKLSYDTVSPYIYASDIETEKVIALIDQLESGQIDLICFTSKAQYQRMQKIADKFSLQDKLQLGLHKTRIAAVGPVVADQLEGAGLSVAVMPDGKFFMKPMVRSIEKLLAEN